MAFAIVFPGQGMQHPAMLPWLADDEGVERTVAALGTGDWRDKLADADWAANNANAQVLLTGLNLAAWAQLSAQLPPPAAVAGYSVGELAAFAAAGVFDERTAVALASERAALMDRCAEQLPGGLLAVSGLPVERVQRICIATGTVVAIDNASAAYVLGGAPDALDEAEASALSSGAHCTRLKVALASHTPSMQGASEAFARTLANLPLLAPRAPLFSNATGARITSGNQAAQALAQQISQTVRWSVCMDNLHARQPDCVLEIGPGAALSKMWNQRFPDVPARSVDEFRSAAAIVAWVLRHA